MVWCCGKNLDSRRIEEGAQSLLFENHQKVFDAGLGRLMDSTCLDIYQGDNVGKIRVDHQV